MDIRRIDLNLLVYLDVLLRERNVTRAASQLGLSQPALSNGLRRLRDVFNDPLLIRTSEGMMPTARADELKPIIRDVLSSIDKVVQPRAEFDTSTEEHFFRIMGSDYAESTLFPHVLRRLREEAPGVILDIMTPSDVSFLDVEQGKVDMVLNRFESMPQSFHQITVWQEDFMCLISVDNPILENFTLDAYLSAPHVWVSKTGMGVGVGMNPHDVQHLGWVDEALRGIDKQRRITVFTRHYQAAMLLAESSDLIVTLPTRAAKSQINNPKVVIKKPPFVIPSFELKMAWSPLMQHNSAHRWMRRLILEVANSLVEEEAAIAGSTTI